jgi:hypothetical protein
MRAVIFQRRTTGEERKVLLGKRTKDTEFAVAYVVALASEGT